MEGKENWVTNYREDGSKLIRDVTVTASISGTLPKKKGNAKNRRIFPPARRKGTKEGFQKSSNKENLGGGLGFLGTSCCRREVEFIFRSKEENSVREEVVVGVGGAGGRLAL